METKSITDMGAQEFDQLIDAFIDRETKDMGELDASLFYTALEEIYAAETEPTTIEVKAQVIGSELHLHLPKPIANDIDIHDNVIKIDNLRFVIQLVSVDELAA